MSSESSFRGKRVVSKSGLTGEVIEQISAASSAPAASGNPPLLIPFKSSNDASMIRTGAASDNPRYASVPRSHTDAPVSPAQTRQKTVASSSVASASLVAVTNRVVASSPESVRPKSAIERAREANGPQRSTMNENQARQLDKYSGSVPSIQFVPAINDLSPTQAVANASVVVDSNISKIASKLGNKKKYRLLIGLWICSCCCLLWLVIGLIIWGTT